LTNLLKVESAFTRGIRQRLDASVIKIAAAVEHDVLDAFFLGSLGNQFTDRLSRGDVRTGLGTLAQRLSIDEAATNVVPFVSSMS
jgi:hypothetical protein